MENVENKTEYLLSIEHLSKSFGKNHVLKDITLKVKKGSVMGLMGENGAGKSTMMKCLFGIYAKDDGNFYLDGRPVSFVSPKDALEHGVAMVHQELNQCLDRTVLDNMWLGRYPLKFGFVDEKYMLAQTKQLFENLKMYVNPKLIMRKMSVSQRQMVEIAKAVSYNAKIIVLDEPTSSLSEREVQKVFEIVNNLKKEGISFIYISHKMDEIFKLCDEVSVLRDGQLIMTKETKNTSMDELISAMVGRSLTQRFPPVDNTPSDELILKVEGLCTKYEPNLVDISFSVRKGEIYGIYGLVGAGRSELLQALFGLRTISKGKIIYEGKEVHFKSSKDAMDHNLAFITEERKVDGMFMKQNLIYNTTISNINKYKSYGIIDNSKMIDATRREIEVMHTKCMGPDDLISSLSGGNQQKVIFGKWLEREPDLFLMDEPTRGIDVGAKYEIYQLIINMAKQGKTCIVVSSEMPEILGITNRIAVMSNYHLAGVVETKKTNQEELLRLSAMYL